MAQPASSHPLQDESPVFESGERSALENTLYDFITEVNPETGKSVLDMETSVSEEEWQSVLQRISREDTAPILQTIFPSPPTSAQETHEKFFAAIYEKEGWIAKMAFAGAFMDIIGIIPHNPVTWHRVFSASPRRYTGRNQLIWMTTQLHTCHVIQNIHRNYNSEIFNALSQATCYNASNRGSSPPSDIPSRPFPDVSTFRYGTVNSDTILAGLKLKKLGYNPVLLNLANQYAPAAAFHNGSEGGTQEENLFKRSTLYLSLWPHRDDSRPHHPYAPYDANTEQKEAFYPMHDEFGAVYSPNVYVFRGSEFSGYPMLNETQRCVMSFIAVAAKAKDRGRRGEGLSKEEKRLFVEKIRTIYRVAFENGHDSVVLGALGCGIFGNPPGPVAEMFREVLMEEFTGCFRRVVVAIVTDHNSMSNLFESFARAFPYDEGLLVE